MNSLIFCLALIISTPKDTTCIDKFYDAALKDTIMMGTSYLKFTIVDSIGSKSVLAINHSLYYFFSHNKAMSYDAYQRFMKDVFSGKQTISLATFKELPHVTLRKNKFVERVARKGKKRFINYFFDRHVFKFKYQQHFEAVVGKLFDYGVLVVTVDNGAEAIVYDADCF
jgi:hypothetical protein